MQSNTVTIQQQPNGQWLFNNIHDQIQYPLPEDFVKLLIPFIPKRMHPNGNMVMGISYGPLPMYSYQLKWKGFDDLNEDVPVNLFRLHKLNTSMDDSIKLPQDGDVTIPYNLLHPTESTDMENGVVAVSGSVFIAIYPKEQFPLKAVSI